MDERDKHKLEGLLQARSSDLRQGRRPRSRRPVADPPPVSHAPVTDGREAHAPGRRCTECGGQIAPQRLRAMPRAARCLECQQSAEQAAARS